MRIPTKSAGDSGRSRPPIPIEAGRAFRRCRPPGEAGSRVGFDIRSVGAVVVKLLTLGGGFAEAFALEREPVGIVHEAIEDGIGDGGIADEVLDRQLTGHDGRAASVPILHDLQEVTALLDEHRSEPPVVEDEKLDASEALEEPSVPTVAACERQGIEEPWQTPIDDRSIIAASLVAERARNPTLADTGRADDQQVLTSLDPLAGDELLEQRLVEAARCLRVDVLDDGVLPQFCEAQTVH